MWIPLFSGVWWLLSLALYIAVGGQNLLLVCIGLEEHKKEWLAGLWTIKQENCSLSLEVVLMIHPLGYCVCILEGFFILVRICIKFDGPKLFGKYQQLSVLNSWSITYGETEASQWLIFVFWHGRITNMEWFSFLTFYLQIKEKIILLG